MQGPALKLCFFIFEMSQFGFSETKRKTRLFKGYEKDFSGLLLINFKMGISSQYAVLSMQFSVCSFQYAVFSLSIPDLKVLVKVSDCMTVRLFPVASHH